MRKFSKINEAISPVVGEIPTWSDLLEMIDNGSVELVQNCERDQIEEYINELSQMNNKDFMSRKIANNTGWGSIKNGFSTIDESYVIIYEGETTTPIAIIREYELMNPFAFGDVIICPGHDSITCYNRVTKESRCQNIR